ncbi:vacuolar protein sorting-associated protein 37B [Culicoides brevitarsis]|uniref:vacuolar protein sorting-associated protein 37B n=1 Tax=Culicoides brevitarsis TaxID=469753 RepID=UPI00307B8C4E
MYQQYINQIQTSISCLTSDELKELLNNDDELERRVDEVLSSLENEKEEMLNVNRALAEENILQEPKIIELKATVNELAEEGKTLVTQVQEKIEEYKKKSGNLNHETALALLQSAAIEAEDKSEQIFQKFLDKEETNVQTFIDEFIESRQLMHDRKLKADKMIELGRSQGRAAAPMQTPQNNFYPTTGLPYPMNPQGGSAPYPMGPSMPMPGGFYRPNF